MLFHSKTTSEDFNKTFYTSGQATILHNFKKKMFQQFWWDFDTANVAMVFLLLRNHWKLYYGHNVIIILVWYCKKYVKDCLLTELYHFQKSQPKAYWALFSFRLRRLLIDLAGLDQHRKLRRQDSWIKLWTQLIKAFRNRKGLRWHFYYWSLI